MGILPSATVQAHVLGQLPGARAWADRRGYLLEFDEDALTLRVPLLGGDDDGNRTERYLLSATFEDFDAVPPAWWFAHPDTGEEVGQTAYPAAPPTNWRVNGGSIFHSNGVICAPWNRRAYSLEGGPHGDWGQLTTWRVERPNMTRAETIAEMLVTIDIEAGMSRGRMAPLS